LSKNILSLHDKQLLAAGPLQVKQAAISIAPQHPTHMFVVESGAGVIDDISQVVSHLPQSTPLVSEAVVLGISLTLGHKTLTKSN
jgi:hypothetical protein